VPVAFRPVALTTAAVYRVVTGGSSVFVKVLRRPVLPESLAELVGEFPWRDEAEFLLSGFPLPPGLRRPRVLRVDDLGDRIALWLEDVRCAEVEWDLPRFRRAALGLGRWAGRRRAGAGVAGAVRGEARPGRVPAAGLPSAARGPRAGTAGTAGGVAAGDRARGRVSAEPAGAGR
jgi:hypothetical protein